MKNEGNPSNREEEEGEEEEEEDEKPMEDRWAIPQYYRFLIAGLMTTMANAKARIESEYIFLYLFGQDSGNLPNLLRDVKMTSY